MQTKNILTYFIENKDVDDDDDYLRHSAKETDKIGKKEEKKNGAEVDGESGKKTIIIIIYGLTFDI